MSKPKHWWNSPKGYSVVSRRNPAPRQVHPIPKRTRARFKRQLKREHGLTRRDMGAIGAGHMEKPWPS